MLCDASDVLTALRLGSECEREPSAVAREAPAAVCCVATTGDACDCTSECPDVRDAVPCTASVLLLPLSCECAECYEP